MTKGEAAATAQRSPGLSYQEILDTDTHTVPEVLRIRGAEDIGPLEIPTDWYLSREIYELEKQHIWRRRWQVACREEDIPEVGDTWLYDIADMSFIVVRSASARIQAFYNSCLHRGRALRDFSGRTPELQCPFHGFTWNLDGTLKRYPCDWDFTHLASSSLQLPEAQVGTWGGFIFINPDADAEPLDTFVAGLAHQFSRWPMESRYKSAHVAKVVNANWKLAQEAFMESYHTITTHPELLPSLGDANSQYDAFDNFSRAISAAAVPSPHITRGLSEQEILDSATFRWDDEQPMLVVADGAAARPVLAAAIREQFRQALGDTVDELCDAEMVDSIYYTLYPNLHPWGGYQTLITYRFRPYRDDHQRSVMECMLLAPFSGARPRSADLRWLGDDENWLAATELGLLANVFQQDMINLENMHRGLRSSQRKKTVLGRYQELKIRHFYSIYCQDMQLT
jgi:phenylpropionate dioxygenase-like ring-hydroxylating dioxygenase large terminal subunit